MKYCQYFQWWGSFWNRWACPDKNGPYSGTGRYYGNGIRPFRWISRFGRGGSGDPVVRWGPGIWKRWRTGCWYIRRRLCKTTFTRSIFLKPQTMVWPREMGASLWKPVSWSTDSAGQDGPANPERTETDKKTGRTDQWNDCAGPGNGIPAIITIFGGFLIQKYVSRIHLV